MMQLAEHTLQQKKTGKKTNQPTPPKKKKNKNKNPE